MTFWDFFHTHPLQTWGLILVAVVTIHMITESITKARDRKERLDAAEKMAAILKEKVH